MDPRKATAHAGVVQQFRKEARRRPRAGVSPTEGHQRAPAIRIAWFQT